MWLTPIADMAGAVRRCFGRQSQRGALRRYVSGVLNDSRRKSMEAMWARLSDPGTYQAFQHFITHAPWDADAIWKRLRDVVPERRGVLILDGTSFPKQGHGVGRRRPSILRGARQGGELPGGGHGCAVDGRTCVAAGSELYVPENG